jgi:hypothetical protein
MQAKLLATAVITGLFALPAAAQTGAERINVPSSGIVLDFAEIDRNNDRMISVEEWNEFLASVRARADAKGTGNAAAGATTGTGATGSSTTGTVGPAGSSAPTGGEPKR